MVLHRSLVVLNFHFFAVATCMYNVILFFQGTSSPTLKVSNMVVGDYTFVLKVTDTGGQTASSSVTVVVQPEKNAPPVAVAGSDKVSTCIYWHNFKGHC